jgi:2,4-dienoyl-CoA reductase-like NADH-dependent reductase (Old Yellow Enzyme family)
MFAKLRFALIFTDTLPHRPLAPAMSSMLFTPLSLRGLTLPNRIVISPMCQYSAVDGSAQDWHLMHLGQLAFSGAGMLVAEATAVQAVGRITPGCLGLYSDANEAALKRVTDALRQHSAMPLAIQLAHAGRKASSESPWNRGQLIAARDGGWLPVAPSAVPHLPDETPPHALTKGEIEGVIESFVRAAERALRIGFDAIELHSAHGYLGHEFLSPIANQRTDEYGCSLENRMRFTLQMFDAVRAVWPAEKPLGVRVSATDWLETPDSWESSEPYSWNIEQTCTLAKALVARGCDWVDVSSGGVSPNQKIALSAGYQVPFAETVKRESKATTIAVGLITDPHQAEAIIANGQADMVALARGMLYNPRWPWHAAAALGASVTAPKQYWRSGPREHPNVLGPIVFGQR